MIKNQKSHISISSNECSDNSLDKNKNKKQSLNNKNLEQYLNKLILISLKHKKFLERNDYFYSQLKRQTNIKKVKLKLTPFQKYEKFKMITKKIKLNKSKNKYPLNTKKYPNKINTLLTTKNYNLLKNKTYDNNCNNLLNPYSNYIINNKPVFNKTKLYINSIDTNNNFYPNLKIKKNKYSHLSYDNTINTMNVNKDKMCQTFRYKTAFRPLNKRIESSNIYNISKGKRSVGILTSAVRPLKIANLKSRNRRMVGLPTIKNYSNKSPIPLICMDDSKFINKIMTNYK